MPLNEYDMDLNIQNYSINDIEKFLHIDGTKKYNAQFVELQEFTIREKLTQSQHINKRFKRDLILFLKQAKQLLIQTKCEKPAEPTTLGRDYPLDEMPRNPLPISNNRNRAADELTVAATPKNFIYTSQNDFNDGTINPLEIRTITKCITIDTKYRDQNSSPSTDFMFKMPDKLNKVVSMQLTNFEIPFNFYNCSISRNNSHVYIEINTTTTEYDDIPIKYSKIVIIPDGNYDQQSIISVLNAAISPADPTNVFSYIRFSLDIDATTNAGTGKVTLELYGDSTHTRDSILSFSIDFRYNAEGSYDNIPITKKIGAILGFVQPYYSLDVSYTGLTRITGENIINVFYTRYIFLVIDEYSNSKSSTYVSAFNESLLDSNILARISVIGAKYYQWLTRTDYNTVSEIRRYHGPIDIQRFRIRLIDELGNTINLNNSDYSICLTIKQMYE